MPARRFSAEQEKEICKLYADGKSSLQIGEIYNCSYRTVFNILKRNQAESRGVNLNSGGGLKIAKSKRELICQEYLDGKSAQRLTKDHEITIASVYKILKEGKVFEPRRRTATGLPMSRRVNIKQKADKQKVSPINEEMYKECVKRYESGESAAAIARRLGFTPYHLYKAFKTNGFKIRRTFNKQDEKSYEQINEAYLAGKSVQEIASSMGLSVSPIYAELRRRNIEATGNALGPEREKEICKLYGDGKTSIDISRQLSIHPSTALKILKKYKVEIRPQEAFSDEDSKMIRELYEEGHTTIFLAEIFGCHPTTIQDSIRRVGGELRDGRGYQDTVQQAIKGEKRFFGKRETSFYVFDLPRCPGYLKPGIAFNIADRRDVSDGEYGELLLQIVFDCRQSAFMLEQAVLVATLDCANCPEGLSDWMGATEVRKICFDDLESLIDFYESEMESMGTWFFAAAYVPMTLAEKKQCLQLAEMEGADSDVTRS